MPTIETLLQEQYKKQNYLIVDNVASNNNYCYLYFSSNALYEKDNIDSFRNIVMANDHYEWRSLRAKVRPKREIFIRDIWLSWYVRGINAEINTYQQLIDFLRDVTKDYVVRCVGASSGGFIGNIVAMELRADLSYCFAGQFSLTHHFDHLEVNPYLREHVAQQGYHWVDYHSRLNDTTPKIIYFHPSLSAQDIEQHDQIRGIESITTISVAQSGHGICIYPSAIPKALSLTENSCKKFCSKVYSKAGLTIKIGGLIPFLYYIARKACKKVYNKVTGHI